MPSCCKVGPVAARAEFTPTVPDFLLTKKNNNSLKGVNGMGKWQTGLRAVQFYFPLWRRYLNNPFTYLFIFNLCSPHPDGGCLQSKGTTSLWSAGCKEMCVGNQIGWQPDPQTGLLLKKIWGEGGIMQGYWCSPLSREKTTPIWL